MHNTLASLAFEGVSLMAGYRKHFCPPGWQVGAFASNSHFASQRCLQGLEEDSTEIENIPL